MRDPQTDPAVSRRLAMARYAQLHSKAAAARHFGCCWRTIDAAVKRVEAYEGTGDIGELQNQPRGDAGRTAEAVEDLVVSIYEESFEPERPDGRRYSAPKVMRLLAQRHGIELDRTTVWRILQRREVWEVEPTQKQAVQRFERSQPNALWQIDLIEREPTAIGEVYGVPILDDHSRYLVALRFFSTKAEVTALHTTYLAMRENGTPAEILCDRGGQFVASIGGGTTHFQEVLQHLAIDLHLAPRAQTKGKEERVIQFIERDFLDEVRWDVTDLSDLNRRAEAWRQTRNHSYVHATTHCTPADRYQPGIQIDSQFLRELFAREERRKVSREATVRYYNRYFEVPDRYIGWSVWVANFFDETVEIRAGNHVIGEYSL